MNKYNFFIIEPDNGYADIAFQKLLRMSFYKYSSGIFLDDDGKDCIWFLTNRKIGFGDLNIGELIKGKYKAFETDSCGFECNCQDTDLPMIENVYDYVKNNLEDWFDA